MEILVIDPFQFYFTGENALANLASLVTILSLGISSIIYFVKKWHDSRSEKSRSSGNLHRELQDTLDSLDRKMFNEDAFSFKTTDNREIFYMNRFFNHDFYDSLIFSGKINFLRPVIQQQVQNIFRQIKMHNQYLELGLKMRDDITTNNIPKNSYKYYEWLDKCEVTLLIDIPQILKKLEKDFGL